MWGESQTEASPEVMNRSVTEQWWGFLAFGFPSLEASWSVLPLKQGGALLLAKVCLPRAASGKLPGAFAAALSCSPSVCFGKLLC